MEARTGVTQIPQRLSVAVFAGGQSSRMGKDKALLPWGAGDLMDRVISTVAALPYASETFIVGDRPGYHGRGVPVIADDFDSAGPLGGIATALRVATESRVLVVAVDMPFLSLPLLTAMAEVGRGSDALVPFVGGWQPLHAIYDRNCLVPVRRQIERGELKISSLFDHIAVVKLGTDWVRAYDPNLRSFENVNTIADYRSATQSENTKG